MNLYDDLPEPTFQERQASKKGSAHLGRVAQFNCLLSGNHGAECRGRTTVQHCQGYRWRAGYRRASDYHTFALCEAHHLRGPNSIEQMGINAWEAKYGEQGAHLMVQRYMLAYVFPDYCVFSGERIDPTTDQRPAITLRGPNP